MGHSHMRLEQSQHATRWKQGMKTTSRSFSRQTQHAVAVIEAHEDAFALEAADLAALAVEGRVAAQAAELDPHRSASRPRMTRFVRDNFQICSPSSRLHRIKPALCGHWQEGDV